MIGQQLVWCIRNRLNFFFRNFDEIRQLSETVLSHRIFLVFFKSGRAEKGMSGESIKQKLIHGRVTYTHVRGLTHDETKQIIFYISSVGKAEYRENPMQNNDSTLVGEIK